MSLLAHYKLNGNATDSSGNENHGTAVNMAYTAGWIGQAGSFTPGVSKVNCPAALIPASNWSMSFWVNPTSFAAARYPCGQSTGGAGGNLLVRLAITTGLLAVYLNGYKNTRAVAAGAWTFVGITYDAGKNLRVFVDSDQYYFAGVNTDILSDVYTAIGAYGAGAGAGYLGRIDSFRIDSPALSIDQMLSIYNHGKGSEECQPWQRLIRPTVQQIVRPLMGAA